MRGVPRSPWPPARPQNYLLLRGSPRAKSEEVRSLWRQSGEAGTRVSAQTTLTAGACRCPGAGPTELLGAQGPAERQQVPVWAARGLPGYPELRRARTPIGWRRGACAQAGEQPGLGAGGGGKPAPRLPPRLIAMTPGFPETWKPCCPPTWAAVRIPCPPVPSLRPGAWPPTYSPHSSGTPKWDTHGPCPAPRPRAASRSHPKGERGGSGELGCPLPGPTGMEALSATCPPAHFAERGPSQPRALRTVERGENAGEGEGRRRGEGANG